MSAMIDLVNIHELLGRGMRRKREALGWRQQDASKEFRNWGLQTWSPVAVSQVETGLRRPSIGDLLLVSLVLGKRLIDLVPDDVDDDEMIDLGTGTRMSVRLIKKLLSGGGFPQGYKFTANDLQTPGDEWLKELLEHSQAEHARTEKVLRPIWDNWPRSMKHKDTTKPFEPPTEAEGRAAERLGVEPAVLKAASRRLWARDFEEERDARAGVGKVAPQALQARRGHASRQMIAELREYLDTVFPDRKTTGS